MLFDALELFVLILT